MSKFKFYLDKNTLFIFLISLTYVLSITSHISTSTYIQFFAYVLDLSIRDWKEVKGGWEVVPGIREV